MDELVNGRMGEWVNGRMGEWVNIDNAPVVGVRVVIDVTCNLNLAT